MRRATTNVDILCSGNLVHQRHTFIVSDSNLSYRVISAEPLSGRVELTLKQTGVKEARGAQSKADIAELKEGQIVTGAVKSITQFGLFVILDGSRLVSRRILFVCANSFLSPTQ